jgi:hypothetical protein
MNGLGDGAGAACGASGSSEQPPGFQLREGAFAGGSQSGVVAAVLLLVLGKFAVAVVRGADSGAGSLVSAVGQHQDVS